MMYAIGKKFGKQSIELQ